MNTPATCPITKTPSWTAQENTNNNTPVNTEVLWGGGVWWGLQNQCHVQRHVTVRKTLQVRAIKRKAKRPQRIAKGVFNEADGTRTRNHRLDRPVQGYRKISSSHRLWTRRKPRHPQRHLAAQETTPS